MFYVFMHDASNFLGREGFVQTIRTQDERVHGFISRNATEFRVARYGSVWLINPCLKGLPKLTRLTKSSAIWSNGRLELELGVTQGTTRLENTKNSTLFNPTTRRCNS